MRLVIPLGPFRKGTPMFTIFDHSGGYNRRDFLRIGTLGLGGLGGLSLSHLLAARAAAGESQSPRTHKSVIFLFMHGGPSQYETFDPKMTAPAGIRCVTGATATTLPGV